MFGLKDYLSKIIDQIKMTNNRSDEAYEKITCEICNRICYNKKDLRIHLRREHPDLTSAQTRT